MSRVVEPCTGTGNTEGLARAASRPHGALVRPRSETESVRPHANSREKMTLGEFCKVAWSDICNAPGVHFSGRDVPGRNQVAQPFGRKRVNLVVIGLGAHQYFVQRSSTTYTVSRARVVAV